VRVTATNGAGSLAVTSAASPVVQTIDCSSGPVPNPAAPPYVTPGIVAPGNWANGNTGEWGCSPTFTYEHTSLNGLLATTINYRAKVSDDPSCVTFTVTATTAQGTVARSATYNITSGPLFC
jgi:hypothetical protein